MSRNLPDLIAQAHDALHELDAFRIDSFKAVLDSLPPEDHRDLWQRMAESDREAIRRSCARLGYPIQSLLPTLWPGGR